MREYEKKTVEVQAVKQVSCDSCAVPFKPMMLNEPECFGGVTLTVSAGYGSAYDMMGYKSYDICDECYDKITKQFSNPEGEFKATTF